MEMTTQTVYRDKSRTPEARNRSIALRQARAFKREGWAL